MKNKRICALILAVLMLLSFCSCNFTQNPSSDENENEPKTEITEQETEQENERENEETEQETEQENEFVVEEGTEMYEVFYSEQMPPLVRTAGYKDPVLSDRTAIDTVVKEAFPIRLMAEYSGLTYEQDRWLYGEYWVKNEDNIVMAPPDPVAVPVRAYFISAFDTEEKFDEYYLQVFTEDTVEFIKNSCEIYETDGRLSGINYHYCAWGSVLDLDLTTVKSKEYIAENTMRVEFTLYDVECNPTNFKCIYTFIYSDKYGWRVDFDSLENIL